MQDNLQKTVISSFWTKFPQTIGKLLVIMKSPCKLCEQNKNVKAVVITEPNSISLESLWSRWTISLQSEILFVSTNHLSLQTTKKLKAAAGASQRYELLNASASHLSVQTI